MAQKKDYVLDPHDGGEYPSWLYHHATIATSGVDTFAGVTDEHIQQFHKRGYLIVRQAFSEEETANGLTGLVDLIAGKNPGYEGCQFERPVTAISTTPALRRARTVSASFFTMSNTSSA